MKHVDFSRLPAWWRNVELGDQQNGKSDSPQAKDCKMTFHALFAEIFNIDMKTIGNRWSTFWSSVSWTLS